MHELIIVGAAPAGMTGTVHEARTKLSTLLPSNSVATIGAGNCGLHATEDMVNIAEHVYLVSLRSFTGDQVLIDKLTSSSDLTFFLEHEVPEIKRERRAEGIRTRDWKSKRKSELEVGGVSIESRLVANSQAPNSVTDLNRLGQVETSCANESSLPGLFGSGGVTNGCEKQIVVAAGGGARPRYRLIATFRDHNNKKEE